MTDFKVNTNWVVISGAPCSGKTSVLEYLAKLGYQCRAEVARQVIEAGLARGLSLREVRGDEAAFQKRLITLKLELENSLDPNELVFLDRGLPDSIAYCRRLGLGPEEVEPSCTIYRYAHVFLFDRLELVPGRDPSRIESDAIAGELDTLIESAYRELGYKPRRVPLFSNDKDSSIAARAAFILASL